MSAAVPGRLSRLVHPSLQADPYLSHRAELLVATALLLAALGFVFIAVLLALGAYIEIVPVIAAATTNSAIAVAFVRLSPRLDIAAAILSLGMGLALLRIAWLEEGLLDASLIWFPLLPAAVVHMVGRRLGATTGIFNGLLVIVLYAFGPRPNEIPEVEAVLRTCVVLGAILFSTMLSIRYEGIRLQTSQLAARIAAEQQAANRALAKAKLEADRANDAKTEFLATVSHELRTPLNGVLGSASLLLESGVDARHRELVQSIHTASEQLQAMIGDILDLSKIEAGHMELERRPFSLSKLLDDIGDMTAPVARKKQIELIFKLPPSVPDTLIGDKVRLRQVVLNLVHNALKFTDHGAVVVDVQPLTIHSDRARLRFDVRDTGIGMTHATLQRLFIPFSQASGTETTRGGTGLGLAICRRLVEAMDGRIDADSQLGNGSTFWFEVEFHRTARDEVTPTPLEGQSVVLVHPDRDHRESLRHHLRAYRTDVYTASHVDQLTGGLEPDALVTGPSQAQALHRRFGRIPTVVVGRTDAAPLPHVRTITPPVRRAKLHLELNIALGFITPPSSVDTSAPEGLPPGSRGHVLVVDDNEINRQVLERMLARLGAAVTLAHDGQDAVDRIRSTHFDLVLMDVHMPKMDGFAATRHIRSSDGPQPTIVAVTASSVVGQREKCLGAGMNDFLAKPVVLPELATLLDRWLGFAMTDDGEEFEDHLATAEHSDLLVDPAALEGVDRIDKSGKSVGRRLVGLFLADLDARREHFTLEHDELIASAHRLRSSAALLGAHPLARALSSIEDNAHQNLALDEAIERVNALIAPTTDALNAWLDAHPEPHTGAAA